MNNLSIEEREAIRQAKIKEYIEKSKNLREVWNEATKTVNVAVNENDIKILMDNNYRMCFAKKVGTESYNVIWQSYVDFSENNSFSWTPHYQIFRTDTFMDNVQIKVSTTPKGIGLGQLTVIDNHGLLSDPVSGGDENAINVKNAFKPTHIGICQVSTGLDGKTISTPIYVSENDCITGDAKFEPVEKVMVWFEANAETSTMFSTMKSDGYEVDLTEKNEVSIKYENGKWYLE